VNHGAYHADHVLRRGGGAVAARPARSQPGRGGDGPRLRSGAGVSAVTLPLHPACDRRGLDAGVQLSLDDLVIASFTTGPGSETLPIRIYSEVRLGVKPEINTRICTLVVAA